MQKKKNACRRVNASGRSLPKSPVSVQSRFPAPDLCRSLPNLRSPSNLDSQRPISARSLILFESFPRHLNLFEMALFAVQFTYLLEMALFAVQFRLVELQQEQEREARLAEMAKSRVHELERARAELQRRCAELSQRQLGPPPSHQCLKISE